MIIELMNSIQSMIGTLIEYRPFFIAFVILGFMGLVDGMIVRGYTSKFRSTAHVLSYFLMMGSAYMLFIY